MILYTVAGFLFVLTIVVFFHELGHFLVARWCGVAIRTFSIGFGPEIMGFNDRYGTRWRLSWIPLGGYVKFIDDDNPASAGHKSLEHLSPEEREQSFQGKSLATRAAVVAAGPLANFVLAIVIFTAIFTVFGERITPNQHKMVRDFVLLDNTYCSGILSADGHQWADTAFATDYMEKSFAGFPRSYPDGMEDDDVDALAYSPAGFIWDNALAHGKSLRVYGEFAITDTAWRDPANKKKLTFLDYYQDFTQTNGAIAISSRPAIESLRPVLNTNTVGWHMDIPDVFRAAQFIKELREFEARGDFPNLVIICLPNDHTSGTSAGSPHGGCRSSARRSGTRWRA